MRHFVSVLRGLVLLLSLSAASVASAQTITLINDPPTVGSGLQSAEIRARLSDSQHGGIFVTITVADSLLARVAPDVSSSGSPSIDVFLPNGSIDARFVFQALEGATGQVQVDVTAPGFGATNFVVDLVTPYYEIVSLGTSTNVPSSDDNFVVRVGVASSAASALSAQRTRAGGPGLDVDVSVDDPLVGKLVTTFTQGSLVTLFIEPGDLDTPANVTAGGVALDGLAAGTVVVTAQIAGLLAQDDATKSVSVAAAAINWVGVPVEVGAGLRTGSLRARLNGPSHGGVTVDLHSLDPSLVLLAPAAPDTGVASFQAFVPDGSIDVFFQVDGLEGLTGMTAIQATAPGWVSATGAVEVSAPFIELQGVRPSQDTLDPADSFYARVGLSSSGSFVSPTQDLRIGSPGLAVSVAVDDSTLAMLETSVARNDTISLAISEGESNTPTSVASGGVELDGISAGTATVTVSAPGFLQAQTGQRSVSITQPSLSLLGLSGDLGSGLVTGLLRARLGATQHGGTTVRVEVSDSTKVLVSSSLSTPGASFVEAFVPDGSIDAVFYAHGLEGVSDAVLVTASATQFQPAQTELEVVTPSLQVAGLSSSFDTVDTPDAFFARTGISISGGVSVAQQDLRPGGPGIDVEFTVSDSTVARLVTISSTAGSQVISIGPGDGNTPSSLALGGVALEGLVPGPVVVSARADGFSAIPASDKTVTILQPTISWVGTTVDLGAGLQSGLLRARLSGTEHGGVLVRIDSTDPARLLVSDSELTPGSDFVERFVPDGSIDAFFYAQALDGPPAAVQITATATGFGPSATDVEVVDAAVDISGLGTTLVVGASPDNFTVRSGVPNSAGSGLLSTQAPRAGGGPLEVSITSGNPAVAELVTLAGASASTPVFIPEGEVNSPSTIAAGGVGARGLSGGNSVIQATAPGFLVVGTAQREVSVASNGIGLAGVPVFLGARLQTPILVAQLEESAHGGVTLSITSGDTNRVLVAPDPLTPGAASLDVFLPNGIGSAQYVLQGREGGSGPVTVNAAAGGAAGSVQFEVVEPALQIVGLPDSLESIDPDERFAVQTGVASADGDSLAQRQSVRTGAGPLLVSVLNSLVSTGNLVTSATEADSVVVEVAEVQFQSAATVGAGGVAFDPAGPGTTTISASAPDFATTTRGAFSLVVFGDPTAAPDLPQRLALEPNVPNPFNPSTHIRFTLPASGRVELSVLDVRGRRVRALVSGELGAGVHELVWTGKDDRGRRVASGVYFLRLEAQGQQERQKMVLLK